MYVPRIANPISNSCFASLVLHNEESITNNAERLIRAQRILTFGKVMTVVRDALNVNEVVQSAVAQRVKRNFDTGQVRDMIKICPKIKFG